MLGVCGKEIKGTTDNSIYNSPYFIGLHLNNGNIFMNKSYKSAAGAMAIVNGSSVIKVVVDMNFKTVKWLLNDVLIYSTVFNS